MLFRKKQKVFCIGQNKTGTTSVAKVLEDIGYTMGRQDKAERFLKDWSKRDFRRIIKYCKSADAFQDVPFSLPYTYQAVDQAYPGSKFILTVRSSAEEWYESLTRYHKKFVRKERVPTAEDLKEFSYIYKGWLWEYNKYSYDINEKTLYDKKIYMEKYLLFNQMAEEYFQFRTEDLLVVNLAEDDAMSKIYQFLGQPYKGEKVPHLNKSK